MKSLHQETKVSDGECVLLYGRYMAHVPQTSIPGHISCDEMKVDENVAWNTNGHGVTGFITNFDDLDNKLRSILCGNTSKQPAVELNQWEYQTCTTSKLFECEFFYNGGNLSNPKIHRQFLPIISCLELIQ
jgi:hypothetical protein